MTNSTDCLRTVRIRFGQGVSAPIDLTRWLPAAMTEVYVVLLQCISSLVPSVLHLSHVSQTYRTATINMTLRHQFTTFTHYFCQRETLFNSEFTALKSFKLAENQLHCFHSIGSDFTFCVGHGARFTVCDITSRFIPSASPVLSQFTSSFSCQPIFVVITILNIHYSFTLSLLA